VTSQEIHVSRADIRKASLANVKMPVAAPGEAVLKIEGFALTANNVTYAATGEVIGYWKFFPPDAPDLGVVPVWGYGRVIDSNSPHAAVGDRFYGFWPMAEHAKIRPEPRGKSALVDSAPHRQALPAPYNAYTRAPDAPLIEDARKAIFYPLLLTSYLLFDFLEDNAWFGARQIIVGSASSKTGLGLCKYLSEARPNGPAVVGLTSGANRAFVTGLGTCDQVVAYDDIASIAKVPSVYVDMAGDTDVRSALHHHLGDDMRHSAAVGTSHWDKFAPTGDMPGARPRFFFAPSQVEKRRADWGAGEVEKRLEGAWRRVAQESGNWMEIKTDRGLSRALEVYQRIADGKVAPATGHYIIP